MPRFTCFGLPVPTRCLSPDDGLAHRAGIQGDDVVRLDAVVTDNNIAGSDPTLQVRAPDGVNWTIELASRARNSALGLTGAQALPGDVVLIVGQPRLTFGEHRIKARHLTINGRRFDLSEPEMAAG